MGEVVKPLSVDVSELVAIADCADTPHVFKRWVDLSDAREIVGLEFPDEVAVIEIVREMVDSVSEMFVLKPKEVADLEVRLAEVGKDQNGYLFTVLSAQKMRCRDMLERMKTDENKLGNLRRGVQRRVAKVTSCNSVAIDHAGIPLSLDVRFEDGGFVVDEIAFLRAKVALARSFMNYAQVAVLNREILALEKQISVIEASVSGKPSLIDSMERISRQLKGVTPLPDDSRKHGGAISHSAGHVHVGPRKRRLSIRESLPDDTLEEERVSPIETDLGKIRHVIELANRNANPVIRVFVAEGGNRRNRYHCQWSALIRKLGFTGEIIFPRTYESLNRGSDPVVMSKGMNTHKGRWNCCSANCFVISTPEKLLLNYLSHNH